jgi:GNAT superfamily N-acetyltransferase
LPEHASSSAFEIEVFRDEDAADFARLNRDWLVRHDLLEDGDLPHLERPRETILEQGGEIFVARADGRVVGVCGVKPHDSTSFELVKLAVDSAARGSGIGTALTMRAIDWARAHGARRVILVSSTKLKAALGLYERLGFVRGPVPKDVPYVTADVYMELAL